MKDMIYLASGLDLVDQVRDVARRLAHYQDVEIVSSWHDGHAPPAHLIKVDKESSGDEIAIQCLSEIDGCDVLIGILGSARYGHIAEIFYALGKGKRVYTVLANGLTSWHIPTILLNHPHIGKLGVIDEWLKDVPLVWSEK